MRSEIWRIKGHIQSQQCGLRIGLYIHLSSCVRPRTDSLSLPLPVPAARNFASLRQSNVSPAIRVSGVRRAALPRELCLKVEAKHAECLHARHHSKPLANGPSKKAHMLLKRPKNSREASRYVDRKFKCLQCFD